MCQAGRAGKPPTAKNLQTNLIGPNEFLLSVDKFISRQILVLLKFCEWLLYIRAPDTNISIDCYQYHIDYMLKRSIFVLKIIIKTWATSYKS